MPKPERQQQVLELLKELRGIEPLKQLFWSELSYQRVNQPLSRRGWTESAAQALAEDPVLFAGGGENNDFHVIYTRLASERLLLGAERPVVSRLVREHPYALFVFSNNRQDRWHFLNVKYDNAVERRQLFRRITVVPGDGLRTASERLALLNLEDIGADRSPLTIQEHHDAAFDVEKVTKDFYAEIANWYFWACDHVEFPLPKGTANPDAYKAQSLIRLVTRLIFCWFVKEKGLIPGELFDSRALAELLKEGADLPNSEETTYYKAVLQNLFFATLNQEMDKRGFRKRNKDPQGRDPHRGITNLYRYEDCFADPKAFLRLAAGIPFLNGGLFECLDKVYRAEEHLQDVRIDGFSDHPKNPLSVPDFLFFGDERTVDLSAAYGEKRYRQATVRGLIQTFGRYKFTITENTPLDQEVALDPELSGKVFENLLAAYNPETATTARKQTGSFYTPREIVDYMVDEALMAYLQTKLNHGDTENTEKKLRQLFAYTDEPHQFSTAEVQTLIAAIDNLKALDPACGSGAFPMGLLHKLVFILGKLDPHNEQWKQKQIAKASEIPDATVREKTLADIEQAFAANELDYGRKLYLIENCIYGVDIQPIAVQIAKMRFFISLIVEQTPTKQTSDFRLQTSDFNLGIRPLPNLETKFVAANTLIGIEKPESQGKLFADPKLTELMTELADIRHQMFTAKSPQRKERLRDKDDAIRAAMAEQVKTAFVRAAKEEEEKTRRALEQATASLSEENAKPPEWHINRFKNLFGEIEETRIDLSKERKQRLANRIKDLEASLRRTTQVTKEIDAIVNQLAHWNPYDQNASADFFDPEWMFGLKDGFDVVTGNPPYVRVHKQDAAQKEILRRLYKSPVGDFDIYVVFIEKSLLILRPAGILSFITPDKFLIRDYGEEIRKVILKHRILEFYDISRADDAFGAAVYPLISLVQKDCQPAHTRVRFARSVRTINVPQNEYSHSQEEWRAANMIELVEGSDLAVLNKVAAGSRTLSDLVGIDAIFCGTPRARDYYAWADGLVSKKTSKTPRVLVCSNISPYSIDHGKVVRTLGEKIAGPYFDNSAKLIGDNQWASFLHTPKILVRGNDTRITAVLDDDPCVFIGVYGIKLTKATAPLGKFLVAALNSTLYQWVFLTKNPSLKIGGGFFSINSPQLLALPFREPTATILNRVNGLVDRIIVKKKSNHQADIRDLETQIDDLIYSIYQLSPDDVQLVRAAVCTE